MLVVSSQGCCRKVSSNQVARETDFSRVDGNRLTNYTGSYRVTVVSKEGRVLILKQQVLSCKLFNYHLYLCQMEFLNDFFGLLMEKSCLHFFSFVIYNRFSLCRFFNLRTGRIFKVIQFFLKMKCTAAGQDLVLLQLQRASSKREDKKKILSQKLWCHQKKWPALFCIKTKLSNTFNYSILKDAIRHIKGCRTNQWSARWLSEDHTDSEVLWFTHFATKIPSVGLFEQVFRWESQIPRRYLLYHQSLLKLYNNT